MRVRAREREGGRGEEGERERTTKGIDAKKHILINGESKGSLNNERIVGDVVIVSTEVAVVEGDGESINFLRNVAESVSIGCMTGRMKSNEYSEWTKKKRKIK
jgi:hypothetical protein